jgi:hypothetical protein
MSLVCLVASGCARGLYGPSLDTTAAASPRPIDELSVVERRALLDRAAVWKPIETAKLDLLAGPPMSDGFAFDVMVACAFHYPDEPLTGVTPKFDCDVVPGDVVKVKYGEANGEVFAEVAATRLFWALGFMADRMYPVRVTCLNCPPDPHRVSSAEWHLGKPSNGNNRVYDPAAIERPFAGKKIEVRGYDGLSWRELEGIADNDVGATRAHVDGLKLLAAFIQHVDSKPNNQALVCPDRSTDRDREGNATCSAPVVMIKDLGSSFAAASKIRFPKMKLESWRSVPIWRDPDTCQAQLTSSIVGTLAHPHISEAGRKFLADRLSLLSDPQLHDLFTAARVDRRKDKVGGRPATVSDWVEAFKEKRAQIVNHRCQT